MSLIKGLGGTIKLFKHKPVLTCVLLQQNGMSQYPDYYIRPVVKHEEQENLAKTGLLAEITHMPTRAALVDQSSSFSNDPRVNQFINRLMRDGLKELARGLVEKAFEKVKRIQVEKYHRAKTDEDRAKVIINPKVIFHKAVDNCKPILKLMPIKRGGVTYQVPVPISDRMSEFMSMKWLILAAKDKERTVHFPEKLAYELIDASNNTGRVVKRKIDLHKQCEANRAYAHYRWS